MADETPDQSSRHDDKSGNQQTPGPDDIIATDAATRSFILGLVARGQAARADASGALPPQATHEIIGASSDGTPILRRRRFA